MVKVIKNASPNEQDGFNPEIRKYSYRETSRLQENFKVYIQALISQCFDANYLKSEVDEYVVSNIDKVDSVTLLRKDKVMKGVSWSMMFQQALITWPCLGLDLCPSIVQDAKCEVCHHEFATSIVLMFGQQGRS